MTVLQPHQQRVVDERAELVDRIQKLMNFCITDTFAALDQAERRRLHAQYHAMESYSYILGERIAAFTP
jgi:hypothetical protein